MPSVLHARGLHAHDRADLLSGGGDLGVTQFPRASTLADPLAGFPRFAIGGPDAGFGAKADDILKAKSGQKFGSASV